MAETAKTIAELILQTITEEEIFGRGAERALYRIGEKPEMLLSIPTMRMVKKNRGGEENYLPATETMQTLLAHTSLSADVTVKPFFYGLRPSTPGVPQAALFRPRGKKIPEVLLIPEIKGDSFTDIFENGETTVEQAYSWPPEIFEQLMRQARTIVEAGLSMDGSLGNILLEKNAKGDVSRLHLIDLSPRKRDQTPNDFFTVLEYFTANIEPAQKEQTAQLYEKLVSAAEKAGFGSQQDYTFNLFPPELLPRLKTIPPLQTSPRQRYPKELTRIGKLAVTQPAEALWPFLERITHAQCGREIS